MEAAKARPDFNKVGKLLDSFYLGTAASALTAKEVPTATERLGMSQEEQSSFFSLEQLEEEAQKRGL